MQGDKILHQNTSLFSLFSGFNHLQQDKVRYCTPISCYFCPLNYKYTQECIFQNSKFWKFLISPSERSELGDTKSLLVGSGQKRPSHPNVLPIFTGFLRSHVKKKGIFEICIASTFPQTPRTPLQASYSPRYRPPKLANIWFQKLTKIHKN